MADLNVHDITLADRPIFSAGGKVTSQRTVSYFIGPHGPFYIQDVPEVLNAAGIKLLIEKHQADLRDLDTIGQIAGV